MTIEDVRRLYCAAAREVRGSEVGNGWHSRRMDAAMWFYATSAMTGLNGVRALDGADFTRPELAGYSPEGMQDIVDAEWYLALGVIEQVRRERFPGVTPATPETTSCSDA